MCGEPREKKECNCEKRSCDTQSGKEIRVCMKTPHSVQYAWPGWTREETPNKCRDARQHLKFSTIKHLDAEACLEVACGGRRADNSSLEELVNYWGFLR